MARQQESGSGDMARQQESGSGDMARQQESGLDNIARQREPVGFIPKQGARRVFTDFMIIAIIVL